MYASTCTRWREAEGLHLSNLRIGAKVRELYEHGLFLQGATRSDGMGNLISTLFLGITHPLGRPFVEPQHHCARSDVPHAVHPDVGDSERKTVALMAHEVSKDHHEANAGRVRHHEQQVQQLD